MSRNYKISKHLEKILKKLARKDKKMFESVLKKLEEVRTVANVEHYKNLRYSLKEYKRIHVASSFVLVFRYDKTHDVLYFVDFDHHDKIYKKQHGFE